jgi:predicted ATP-dependent serine protease
MNAIKTLKYIEQLGEKDEREDAKCKHCNQFNAVKEHQNRSCSMETCRGDALAKKLGAEAFPKCNETNFGMADGHPFCIKDYAYTSNQQ